MSEEYRQLEVPKFTGSSSDEVFAFLSATREYWTKIGTSGSIYTPHVELQVQQEVIARFEANGLTCRTSPKGTGFEWAIWKESEDFEPDRKMRFDQMVEFSALTGPIFGTIYGAFNGDILHGFLTGFFVGNLPLFLILASIPFMLIYERYFEKHQ